MKIIKAFFIENKQHNGDAHLALHDMLDCLAETIWQAQRNNTALDNAVYLDLLKHKLKQV